MVNWHLLISHRKANVNKWCNVVFVFWHGDRVINKVTALLLVAPTEFAPVNISCGRSLLLYTEAAALQAPMLISCATHNYNVDTLCKWYKGLLRPTLLHYNSRVVQSQFSQAFFSIAFAKLRWFLHSSCTVIPLLVLILWSRPLLYEECHEITWSDLALQYITYSAFSGF